MQLHSPQIVASEAAAGRMQGEVGRPRAVLRVGGLQVQPGQLRRLLRTCCNPACGDVAGDSEAEVEGGWWSVAGLWWRVVLLPGVHGGAGRSTGGRGTGRYAGPADGRGPLASALALLYGETGSRFGSSVHSA